MAAREWPGADEDGGGGSRVQAVYLDVLADAELVGEDEVSLLRRQRGIDGVGGVGDLDAELVGLCDERVLRVQLCRHDLQHLQHRSACAVLPHRLRGAGLHVVQEPQEDAGHQHGHVLNLVVVGIDNSQIKERKIPNKLILKTCNRLRGSPVSRTRSAARKRRRSLGVEDGATLGDAEGGGARGDVGDKERRRLVWGPRSLFGEKFQNTDLGLRSRFFFFEHQVCAQDFFF